MLTTDLTAHLALITGATGGIGRATCHALAELKCSIAVHYHSAEDTASTLISDLRAKGIRAERFQADLRNYDGVRELHRQVVEKMGHPTILFNNAGITMKSGVKDISEVSIEIPKGLTINGVAPALITGTSMLPGNPEELRS
ncbi:MAG: hypothetical protein Q9191_003787, partial [Dirinaria sp. TL-2023a]